LKDRVAVRVEGRDWTVKDGGSRVPYTQERLGELLVKAGALDAAQLESALNAQMKQGGKLGRILVELGIISETKLADILAFQKGLSRISLPGYQVNLDAVALLPERVAVRKALLPVGFDDDGAIVVAMADPLDIEALDDIELRSGRRAVPMVTTETEIFNAIEKYMTGNDALQEVLDQAGKEDEGPIDEGILKGGDVPVVRLVNQIFKEAVSNRASDIHFEPFEHDVVIRYRVDGVLHEIRRLPRTIRAELTSRIKIMADMDITERRRPQDGRIALRMDNASIDLRVSTLPTPYGESIVIRILSSGLTLRSLSDIGMGPHHLEMVSALAQKPYGAILVAGPTGSGKSTTLYACIERINDETIKIITIEEPVENRLPGCTQMGVNADIGLTFANGLRQILRSDPDCILIGEIRDPETAEIAARAALTGHLVFSSIHTNDAPSTLARLSDMQVPPFVTSASLLAVIAQRLVRRLCTHCKKRIEVDPAVLVGLGAAEEDIPKMTLFEPVGCPECLDTGYHGRLGVFEIMMMDDEIRQAFLKGAPTDELRWLAVERGMQTLRQDALVKAGRGDTSLEELARILI
jgi:type IV pilus assembly protein PilB